MLRLTSAATSGMLDTEQGRASLLNSLLDQYLEGPTLQMTHRLRNLAVRELPPGTWAGVYLLYQAHCISTKQRPASRALFYAVTKPWRKVVKFRRRSQHSVCSVCDRLKAAMRHAKSFVQHAAAADQLLGHLCTTWQCRQIYWAARERSRHVDADVLCLICDGYDKGKPVIPRWSRGRPPKGDAFDRVNRPAVQISCVLAHGHGCLVFMTGAHELWRFLLLGQLAPLH